MNRRAQLIISLSVIALFLVVCTSQVYLAVSFAQAETPVAVSSPPVSPMQDKVGILTTIGNKPITVNTATSITGATILSGASIETPEGVGATVTMGKLGSLEIEPGAKLTLSFQTGSIKVMLLAGCVTMRANKGTTGEIETSKGTVGKTDPKTDGVLRVCHPDSVRLAAIAVPTAGLGKLATLAIIGGPAALIIPAIMPGSNPSNSNPS